MIPRSTQDRGQSDSIAHGSHAHPEYDSDSRSCRISESGVICVFARKGIRRALIADNRAYSCLEPDDEILEAVGCRR